MFLLILSEIPYLQSPCQNLHSTMFLLILSRRLILPSVIYLFTFHYVSTYTMVNLPDHVTAVIYIPLCFYLYQIDSTGSHYLSYLHSTMFLLILRFPRVFAPDTRLFTFHYVSTYTLRSGDRILVFPNLHSTMFLLIQPDSCWTADSHPYLHSTMFLLILITDLFSDSFRGIYIPLCFYLYHLNCFFRKLIFTFTFHYVSTYTGGAEWIGLHLSYLHSTMFLLIQFFQFHHSYILLYLHSTMFLLIQDSPS